MYVLFFYDHAEGEKYLRPIAEGTDVHEMIKEYEAMKGDSPFQESDFLWKNNVMKEVKSWMKNYLVLIL